MISLRVPRSSSSSSGSRRMNRSSTVMSGLLDDLDRALRAIGHGATCGLLLVGRDDAVAEDHSVALVVFAEQVGGEVVAATMPLANLGVDPEFHRAAPVFVSALASPATIRVSSAAQSSSLTACRSAVISALPIDSSRQRWASASGDSAGSISPSA